ncbi:MAG: cytochrome c oxidase subunit II [Sphingobacteriales bacterium]|nr:cytochrome c oxidase subunit II [Sphingobacteriales bacterium]
MIILYQVARIHELVGDVRNDEEQSALDNNRLQATLFMVFLVVGMTAAIWSTFHYAPLYLPEPSSEHGMWIRNMFFWTLVATVPVFFITHILLFYYAYRYQGKSGKLGTYFPHSNKLELIWTSVPAVVMIALVAEGMHNWYKITAPAPADAVVVEVTGQQFKWDLRYAGKDGKLGQKKVRLINSDNPMGQVWEDKNNNDDFIANELHLPLGKPVLMKINALDVLHSFYLPHFRVKMDAVPGIPTQFWFTPTKTTAQMRQEMNNPEFDYELACAELCGNAHYNMRKVVIVETEEEFNKWLAAQEPILAALKPAQDAAPAAPEAAPAEAPHSDTPAADTTHHTGAVEGSISKPISLR